MMFAIAAQVIMAGQGSLIELEPFKHMSAEERLYQLKQLPFAQLDSAQLSSLIGSLSEIIQQHKDFKSLLYLYFQQYWQRGTLKMPKEEAMALCQKIEALAAAKGLKAEEIIAHQYIAFEAYYVQKTPHEHLYVEIVHTFKQMKALGFEHFEDFKVESLLLEMGQFMYGLEDFEKMLEYLSVAKRFIHFDESGQYCTNLVMNYLQTYYQRRKEYPQAISYAKGILTFNQNLVATKKLTRWRKQFWQGLAMLDIANMLIERGKWAQGESYADQGYIFSQVGNESSSFEFWHAEYDALQVLLTIKLKLGKLEEAAMLIKHALQLKQKLEHDPQLYAFKFLNFYHNCAQYHELRSEYGAAIQYTRLAQALQDSLDQRNEARKYELLQKRLEIEQYSMQIKQVEKARKIQQWLMYSCFFILFFALVWGYNWYRRIQNKRQQALTKLESLTRAFHEKSAVVNGLNQEIEKLAALNHRSDYLEELTRKTILTEADWSYFKELFEKVFPGFISDQKSRNPNLTRAELRMLALEKLNLDPHEIARILGISLNSVYKTRQRLRKKDSNIII